MEYEPEIINTKLAGVTFEGRQQVIQAIARLIKDNPSSVGFALRPEPDNKYDPNAIAIDAQYYDPLFLTNVTRQVGYISKKLAEIFRQDINDGYEFEVLEFNTTGGNGKNRGINIRLLRKEAGMTKITALDLIKKKSDGGRANFLRLSEGAVLTLRFLRNLDDAFVKATHSLKVKEGRYERFSCLKYIDGYQDDSIECPADMINDPWIKIAMPVIDRADNKVKLFEETVAVYKKLQIMEEQPANDAEKTIKLGGVSNADVTIMQQGKGKERMVTAFPVGGTVRPLNTDEKKLLKNAPENGAGLRVLTTAEIQGLVDSATQGAQVNVDAQNMTVKGPFDK